LLLFIDQKSVCERKDVRVIRVCIGLGVVKKSKHNVYLSVGYCTRSLASGNRRARKHASSIPGVIHDGTVHEYRS